jgi:hypothetical protein
MPTESSKPDPVQRGELLIAIVKNREDIVVACDAQGAESAGKSLDEVLNRKSSETWPDYGMKYVADDQEVFQTQQPKLSIAESVLFKGIPTPVLTDKYPVGAGDLILVLVFARSETIGDHTSLHTVARVRPQGGWKPKNCYDTPSQFEVLYFECVPSRYTPHMDCEEAEELMIRKNQERLDCGNFDYWFVWLPPYYGT